MPNPLLLASIECAERDQSAKHQVISSTNARPTVCCTIAARCLGYQRSTQAHGAARGTRTATASAHTQMTTRWVWIKRIKRRSESADNTSSRGSLTSTGGLQVLRPASLDCDSLVRVFQKGDNHSIIAALPKLQAPRIQHCYQACA